MTWQAVARKDFRDAVRSWWLWGLTGLFVVFFTLPAYFIAEGIGQIAAEQGGEASSDVLINVLAELNAFFIPIIAIVIAYASIAGERESGSLKLLLSLPHSRLDVVVGKLLGRGGVIVIPVLVGFVCAALVFAITPVTFNVGTYAAFTLLTALLGLIFVAIAVGISAAARSGRQAMVGTVSVYVLFTLFWSRFAEGMVSLLDEYTDIASATLVHAQLFVELLNPASSYESLAVALTVEDPLAARANTLVGLFDQPLLVQVYAEMLDPLPAYFSNPAVVVLFLVWLVLPPAIGYRLFREEDL